MKPEDVAGILDLPISRELLGSSIPARLAYLGVNGEPRVIPIAFLWAGGRLVMATIPSSPKARALRHNPRVALTIDTQDRWPPHALLIRGAASTELVHGVSDAYVEGSRKLIPSAHFEAWEHGVRAIYDEMVLITVEPDWARLLDFETTLPQAVEELLEGK